MTYSDDEVKQLRIDETERLSRPDGKIRRDYLGGCGDFYFVDDDDLVNDLRDSGLTIRNMYDPVILTDD